MNGGSSLVIQLAGRVFGFLSAPQEARDKMLRKRVRRVLYHLLTASYIFKVHLGYLVYFLLADLERADVEVVRRRSQLNV